MTKILLGFETGTGVEVYMEAAHTVVTGMTQLSGKTTALEALVERGHVKAIAFLTKRGESGFQNQRLIQPYFKEQKKGALIDWQYVSAILEATMSEKMKFERSWIIKACKGAHSLGEVYTNIKSAQADARRALDESVYENLGAYFEIILPEMKRYVFANRLDLRQGFNVMDLVGMADEMQQLIMESVISYVLKHESNTVVVIPEAHKFIPQSKNTPVKATALRLIREGAAIGNFLWIDTQETTAVDKSLLKQVSNWIMGYQQEKNEVQNVRDNLGKRNITDEDIMTLPLGHFMVSLQQEIHRVYILPSGIDPEMGRLVALGKDGALAAVRSKLAERVKEVYETVSFSTESPDALTGIREMSSIPGVYVRPWEETWEKKYQAQIDQLTIEREDLKDITHLLDDVIAKKDSYIDELHAEIAGANEEIYQHESFKLKLVDYILPSIQRANVFAPSAYAQSAITPEVANKLTASQEMEKYIEEIFDKKIAKLGKTRVTAITGGETSIPWINAWLPKLNNGGQKKILILVASKHPLPLSKTNIAQMIGVVASGGSFNSNLGQLVKWKLLERDGDVYHLPEVPR